MVPWTAIEPRSAPEKAKFSTAMVLVASSQCALRSRPRSSVSMPSALSGAVSGESGRVKVSPLVEVEMLEGMPFT